MRTFPISHMDIDIDGECRHQLWLGESELLSLRARVVGWGWNDVSFVKGNFRARPGRENETSIGEVLVGNRGKSAKRRHWWGPVVHQQTGPFSAVKAPLLRKLSLKCTVLLLSHLACSQASSTIRLTLVLHIMLLG